MQKRLLLTSLILALQLQPHTARAETGADRAAAAEKLFREGLRLLERHEVAEACRNLEASQELDEGLGTLLHLAHCYELSGKTASAWAKFNEALSLAEQRGERTRARAARSRADALKPLLAELQWEFPAGSGPADYRIYRGGLELPEATLELALPIDPGTHEFRITRRNRQPRVIAVQISAGPGVTRVQVPELPVDEARPAPTRSSSAPVSTSEPLPRAAPEEAPPKTPKDTSSPTLVYALGASGLASLAAGATLGWLAKRRYADATEHCRTETLCSERGLDERKQAAQLAFAATASVGTGAVLLSTGLILWWTDTPAGSSTRDTARVAPMRVGVALDSGGAARLDLAGSF